MLVKNKDASSITLQNQNRTLYANYVIQKNRVDNGCQMRVTLENGGVGESSILTKIKQGEIVTTVSERNNDLALNACPVVSAAPPDPYLSDKIYLALTTNASVYKSASSGSWVSITSAEYAAVQTSVANTSLSGLNANTFNNGTFLGAYTLQNYFTTNRVDPIAPAIPANNYVYAFAIILKTDSLTTAITNLRVYTNNNTSVYSNFSQIGNSPLPSTVVAGKNYFVLKGVSNVSASTDGLLAISAPGDNTLQAQSYNIPYITGLSGSGLQANNGVTLPITTSTTMPSNGGNGWASGIQALTTSSIQWVT